MKRQFGEVSCVFWGVQAGSARESVAIFLSERLGRCLRERKDSEFVEGMWFTLVQVHVPTGDSNS